MKANELMIGNWVKCGKRYMKVTQLAEDMDCDDIEPIPITPEILEKNGFEKLEDGSWSLFQALYQIYWSADPLYLEISSSYTSQIGDFSRMGIQFVHELQHALKLCGIDKTIEL